MKKALIYSSLLVLAACSGDSDNDDFTAPPPVQPPTPEPSNASFEISVVNLTSGQPVSPLAVIAHDDTYRAFSVGQAASQGLEVLAESGDNSELLQGLPEDGIAAQTSTAAPLPPGGSETISLALDSPQTDGLRLTVLTMLVNTNDAITGINGADLDGLGVDESMTLSTIAYDSGTEANSETAGTVPGPAAGGEGFNAARDDIRDQVTMHGGVVTAEDGLGQSALGQQHRWDNPVLRLRITRIQ